MKIVFMGTPVAAVPSFARLVSDGHEIVAVYCQPDRPSGRGNKVTFSPVKQFAIDHDIDVFQPLKIRTVDAIEKFRSHSADVSVVVAYGRILPEPFLDAFEYGAINVHFSLLPKYRGAAPVNWAIVNGETESGVTTMKMDAGLDTGDILLQRRTPINDDESAVELMGRLAVLGADVLSETLKDLTDLVPRPQNNQLATFAPIMKKGDGLIDWSMSASDIRNCVRGFQPFPTTFTLFRGSRLTLWDVEVDSGTRPTSAVVGQILTANGAEMCVQCGNDSVLRVFEVQLEGKRRMLVRDFLNGARPAVGENLG